MMNQREVARLREMFPSLPLATIQFQLQKSKDFDTAVTQLIEMNEHKQKKR